MPGRYEHNPDPQLAELLHEVTEEGWGNDRVGDLDQDGFHASLLIVEPAEQQELSEAFDRAIPAGNWILTQDQHGFVTLGQYPTPAAARHAFDHLPDLDGPGEDGTITRPGRSAAATRSRWPGPSSATPTTWTKPWRCCGRRWTPTATGRMSGSSATTATPTASTSDSRDHKPRPLQDCTRPGAALPLRGLRGDGGRPASADVLGSRRPSPAGRRQPGPVAPARARSAPPQSQHHGSRRVLARQPTHPPGHHPGAGVPMRASSRQNTSDLGAESRYGPTPVTPGGGADRPTPAQAGSGEEHRWPPDHPADQSPAQPATTPPAPAAAGAQGHIGDQLARLPAMLTVKEVAAILRVGRNQLYQAIARGELCAVRIGRTIRIPRTAVLDLLSIPPATPSATASPR